ncbi:DNA-binding MarR family transcriptional regulator [Salinibacterium sp. CAN_S4]|uniref:MarR family winged helix-turn-helix transcriptional regulator n=1 Tax=Salinibacterium sp. CAN_S4 TaxID=2787727 RepID=UPI0018F01023
MDTTVVIESLIGSTHKLTRIAARWTGSSVSSAVWSTLAVLRTDGPHRIGELAKAARISQPGMTKLLQNLVEDEWVLRIADTEDSRAWLIAITPKGHDALVNWRHELAQATTPMFDELSESDWRVLEHATRILAARVDAAAVAA